eukprot:509308_1
MSKHFSTTWLSDFANEAEYLFLQNQYPLHIGNIYDVTSGQEMESILNALTIIEIMTSGSEEIYQMFDEPVKLLIINILAHSIDLMSEYAGALIDLYCSNKDSICIDCSKG